MRLAASQARATSVRPPAADRTSLCFVDRFCEESANPFSAGLQIRAEAFVTAGMLPRRRTAPTSAARGQCSLAGIFTATLLQERSVNKENLIVEIE